MSDQEREDGDGPDRAMSSWRRMAIAAGLVGLAVVQPVLAIFGDSPEFFVSGGYSTGQIVLFGIVATVVPVVIAVGVVGAAHLAGDRVGRVVSWGVWGLAALTFGSYLTRQVGIDSLVVSVAVGGILAAAVVVGSERVAPVRLFLSYLAVGPLLYLALFSFGSRTAELVAADGSSVGRVEVEDTESPVIVLLLDELPMVSLLDADGEIDDERFPAFARLAETSTLYRNAGSRWSTTPLAVPEALTGVANEEERLPTAAEHPRNLLSMLGAAREVNAIEVATDLCASEFCDPPPRPPLDQAFEDAAVVLGRKALPSAFGDALPPIDAGYGGFFDQETTAAGAEEAPEPDEGEDPYAFWRSRPMSERVGAGQRAVLRDVTDAIGPDPALHLLHVALPHSPWSLTPWGEQRNSVVPSRTTPGSGTAKLTELNRRLHLLQLGATDALLGELLDHLEDQGVFDQALVAVVADHGVSFAHPQSGRVVTDSNRDEVLRVPMFIKSPGQVQGAVDDRVASTLDLVPTIADILGAEVDWEFDGHSLLGDETEATPRRVDDSVQPLLDLARQRAATDGGPGWRGLTAIGPHGDLVGDAVADHVVGEPDERTFELDQELTDLPSDGDKYPYVLTGTLFDTLGRADDLLVAVDGRIAGAVVVSVPHEGGRFFHALTGDVWDEGDHEVSLLAVDDDGVLHPLAAVGDDG